LVSQGKIDLKPLVTHRFVLTHHNRIFGLYKNSRFAFNDATVAFKATRAGKSEDGKAVIKAIISGPDVSVKDV
jgi:D-xylulose reductase